MHFTITIALAEPSVLNILGEKMLEPQRPVQKKHASRSSASRMHFIITIALAEPSVLNILMDKMSGTPIACSKIISVFIALRTCILL